MKAIWKGTVIAESSETRIVENNHYFPPEDIKDKFFKPSEFTTRCPWKGKASYYDIEVEVKKMKMQHGSTQRQVTRPNQLKIM